MADVAAAIADSSGVEQFSTMVQQQESLTVLHSRLEYFIESVKVESTELITERPRFVHAVLLRPDDGQQVHLLYWRLLIFSRSSLASHRFYR